MERQLRLLDELEKAEQDPDQFISLAELDHLARRMRRDGANLLALAGEEAGPAGRGRCVGGRPSGTASRHGCGLRPPAGSRLRW